MRDGEKRKKRPRGDLCSRNVHLASRHHNPTCKMLFLLLVTSVAVSEGGPQTALNSIPQPPPLPWTKHGAVLITPYPKKKDYYIVALPKRSSSYNKTKTSVEVQKSMELPLDMIPLASETANIIIKNVENHRNPAKHHELLENTSGVHWNPPEQHEWLESTSGVHRNHPEQHEWLESTSGVQRNPPEKHELLESASGLNRNHPGLQEWLENTRGVHRNLTQGILRKPGQDEWLETTSEEAQREPNDVSSGAEDIHKDGKPNDLLFRQGTVEGLRKLFPPNLKKSNESMDALVFTDDKFIGPVFKTKQINIFVDDPGTVHIMSKHFKGPVAPPFKSMTDPTNDSGTFVKGLNIFKKLYNSF